MTGKTPYWWQEIEEAKRRGYFSNEAVDVAGDWTTCACGGQDSRIPRHRRSGAPLDRVLFELGSAFSDAVFYHNPLDAERLLLAIEDRASEVLAGVCS